MDELAIGVLFFLVAGLGILLAVVAYEVVKLSRRVAPLERGSNTSSNAKMLDDYLKASGWDNGT
jgi:hypothetical protein